MWVTGIDAGWTEIATNFKMWDILGELDTLFTDAILQVFEIRREKVFKSIYT